MSKFVVLLLSTGFIYTSTFSQTKSELSGVVVDENNLPLIGATVLLYPIQKGMTTDTDGKYLITGIEKGKYEIEISFIGYETHSDTIQIKGNTTYDVKLSPTSIGLHEVVVKDDYAEMRKREESLNTEVVNEQYLKQNLGGSLMKSIGRLPGVTSIDIGSGQSKPVIRGLGFNRVVVVENGIKHEGQQWGADHGLEIDQYAVERLEVIKGPASLMYGSDAIGGIIDIKQDWLPAEYTINGQVDLVGKTNNNLLGTSISLSARKKSIFVAFRATLMDYGDYKVPTDSVDIYSYRASLYKNRLRNTAGKEHDLHLSFGYIMPNFQSKFYISNINSISGFFANAHGLEPRNVDEEFHDKSSRDINYPYQQVNHFKIINKSQWEWEKFDLNVDLGFQRNFRQEWSQYTSHGYMPPVFPDTMNFDAGLERQFDKYIYSGNLKLSYNSNGHTSFTVGTSGEYQDNDIDGRGFIIPAFDQLNVGTFVFAKHFFSERSILQAGVRYDFGHINTRAYYDWFPSPVDDSNYEYLQRSEDLSRNFSNVSWSIGYNYNLDNLLFKANVGKSFRMPIAKELAANGVNYHHFSYEVGDPDLDPEISYQLDAGIEYNQKKFAIGATPFLNYFSNYIYLNPTSEHDRLYGNGNQVYNYTQSKVLRYGGEIHAHYQITEFLQLGAMGEYVYSEQLSGEKKGFTLPFSPPTSMLFNLKFKKPRLMFIDHGYLSIDYRITAEQNNIVPPEEPTDGFQVVNIGMGGDINFKNQKLNFSLQLQNLFNVKYFNHTSFYRLINVPEPGRNFVLNISIPISGKLKQK